MEIEYHHLIYNEYIAEQNRVAKKLYDSIQCFHSSPEKKENLLTTLSRAWQLFYFSDKIGFSLNLIG